MRKGKLVGLVSRQRVPEQLPVPAVAGKGNGQYTVGQPLPGSHGSTSYEGKFFGVPLGDKPEHVAVRAHEYAHLTVDALVGNKGIAVVRAAAGKDWSNPVLDNVVNGMAIKSGVG